MKKIKAFLFDMDGVVTDTETQYDLFLSKFVEEYNLPADFVAHTKGTTLKDILRIHFPHLSLEEQKKVADRVKSFELNDMVYNPINGVVKFIQEVKNKGIRVALVTSSMAAKTKVALAKMKLEDTFEVVVTSDDITIGKPNPECYLLAAKKLGLEPSECWVFEDAFAGIEAAKNAGIKVVVGVATTNSVESLQMKADKVIHDFGNVSVNNDILNSL